VFNPYWNIPKSILHQEILPLLEKDPRGVMQVNSVIAGKNKLDIA
jgi:murein L,D-transpeptidase YcbB/YkuD